MCDGIILGCLIVLAILGSVSFFVDPAYERGVWIVLAAVSHLLAAAAGAKFGLSVPQIGIGVREDENETPVSPASSDAGDGPRPRMGFAPSVNE